MFFKPGIQFNYTIFDLRKNENDKKKKEVIPRIININKHLDNEVKEKTIKLRYDFKNIFYISVSSVQKYQR